MSVTFSFISSCHVTASHFLHIHNLKEIHINGINKLSFFLSFFLKRVKYVFKILDVIKIISSVFHLGTLPWVLFLSVSSLLLNYNHDCNWGKWGLPSLDVVLGPSVTSWMSSWCALSVMLVGPSHLARFTIIPSFLYLWIMALTVAHYSPKT